MPESSATGRDAPASPPATPPTDHGEVLNDLWSAERCAWRVEHHGGDGAWVVLLEWTAEYDNSHHADWVTYTWQFYGDTVDEALSGAVKWCEDLWPWQRCGACDGNGWYWGPRNGRSVHQERRRCTCDECHGSGLHTEAALSAGHEATS